MQVKHIFICKKGTPFRLIKSTYSSLRYELNRLLITSPGCTDEEAQNSWTKNIELGNVNNKHFVLSLKLKSVLDPCEDDNVCLGADSMQQDGDSEANDEYYRHKVNCKNIKLKT
ncbi:hypothetical protein L1987_79461 [Smallanthus sonchifolius]|uniref:Uncharacterized protein n=1 Tax=Smallanthus sonchifolius TaxID=185202 RepID=A0ACB8ZGJ4_9ASTR|nr:hypothetical protein L1987_79461 [Smallanthus sonchifolius]